MNGIATLTTSFAEAATEIRAAYNGKPNFLSSEDSRRKYRLDPVDASVPSSQPAPVLITEDTGGNLVAEDSPIR